MPLPWRQWLADVTELLCPSICWACGVTGDDPVLLEHGLCASCHAAATDDPAVTCSRCAASLRSADAAAANGCIHCRDWPVPLAATVRLGPYDGVLRELVLRLKVPSGEPLAVRMGRLLGVSRCAIFEQLAIDLITCVPLHWRRRWRRGHNQADGIARGLATVLQRPYQPRLLVQTTQLPQHVQPSASARWQNIRGAFRLRRPANLDGQRILVVDDVMTTGSTLAEIAQVLHAAGAAAVLAAVLARR